MKLCDGLRFFKKVEMWLCFWCENFLKNLSQSVSFQNYIPTDKLISAPYSVIDFPFKGRAQNKISINNCDLTNRCKSSKCFVFDISSLKKTFEYLIRNCYFAIGDQFFQQINGIRMGLYPPPFYTNLFLFYHE